AHFSFFSYLPVHRSLPSFPTRRSSDLFRIWQAPGVVVFDLEMIHDTRVIFTDGRPPLPSAHKHYMGDSRGRWEGNTLVVETTNRSEEHTSELQSPYDLVCRLLLEKKKK